MSAPALRQVLGFRDVVLFFVAAVVGLRWIATAAAAGPSALVVWIGALLFFFLPLAFTVIELGSLFPDEGGLYVWVKRAFGDFAGFVAGWMYWMSTLVYFPGLLYFSAGNALFVAGPAGQAWSANPVYYVAFSLIVLIIALLPNLFGLRFGKWLHNAGGIGTWVPVAILVVLGGVALARFGPATSFSATTLTPRLGLADMVFWSTLAFGFGGFEAASFMSGEIREPRRTIPRAVLAGGAIIGAIYLAGTAAVLVALPPGQATSLQGIMQAISATAERVGLPAATIVVALLITVGNVGGVGAWLASTSRLPFVAGVDRALPAAFARLHPRWGTPVVALLLQAAISALFVVLGQAGTSVQGAYDVLVGLGVVSYFIPYLMMFAALLKLSRRPRALVCGVLGLAVTALSIVLAVLPADDSPDAMLSVVKVVGSSVVLVTVGALLFLRGRARARRA